MIVQLNQIGRQPNPIFEGKSKGKIIIKGIGNTRKNAASINVNGKTYELSDQLHRETLHDKVITQVTDVIMNHQRVGFIYPDIVAQKKILFITLGYDYFEFHFQNDKYQIYEIGLGPNEHYICILNNGVTIAIIHKDDLRKNFRDNYTLYIENENDLDMAAITTLYFDCVRYPDHGEITGGEEDNDSFLTVQKELNDKYDPTFIPRIKAMEGITDEMGCNGGYQS